MRILSCLGSVRIRCTRGWCIQIDNEFTITVVMRMIFMHFPLMMRPTWSIHVDNNFSINKVITLLIFIRDRKLIAIGDFFRGSVFNFNGTCYQSCHHHGQRSRDTQDTCKSTQCHLTQPKRRSGSGNFRAQRIFFGDSQNIGRRT